LETIMAQLDDLRASLAASNKKIGEVAGKVDAVQADVQALIDRLGQVTPPIPDDIMQSAAELQSKVNAVADDLDTTPKPPPQA
jgi:hypothetical protein